MSRTIWFTSDTHFGHKNIIKFCDRPYSDVNEMDEQLINNINDCVGENDILYHMGDFAWKSPSHYRARIKCKEIHLVLGNHDKYSQCKGIFSTIEKYNEIKIADTRLCLFHFPIASWNRQRHGNFHLCGHSHGDFPPSRIEGKDFGLILDCGVDVHDYKPICFDEVCEIMSNKKI